MGPIRNRLFQLQNIGQGSLSAYFWNRNDAIIDTISAQITYRKMGPIRNRSYRFMSHKTACFHASSMSNPNEAKRDLLISLNLIRKSLCQLLQGEVEDKLRQRSLFQRQLCLLVNLRRNVESHPGFENNEECFISNGELSLIVDLDLEDKVLRQLHRFLEHWILCTDGCSRSSVFCSC